jgi:hypothetical protein
MDEETKAALDALKAEIAALTDKLAALKQRPEPESAISLNAYAAMIGFPRTSARRRVLDNPGLGTKVGGRWRIKP